MKKVYWSGFIFNQSFYDEGDHITVKGFIWCKESHEVYEQNLLGEGYIKIS